MMVFPSKHIIIIITIIIIMIIIIPNGIFYLHYENTPIQIFWKFYHQEMKIFR